jgi:hypothetical protein
MKLQIGELREDYALRVIATGSFEANALYLEIFRLPTTSSQCSNASTYKIHGRT